MTIRGSMRGVLAAGLLLAAATTTDAQTPVPLTVEMEGGEVTVIADHLEERGPERLVIATGNVEITRGRSRLTADRVEINRDSGDAVARGRVVFYDGQDRLTSERIDYNIKTGTGVVYEGEARSAPYYRLGGERLERLGESVYHVQRGVFTTCEDDPPAWSFHIGSGTVDLEDFVYGTGASFWVRNFPLIPYFPFFAAAIRKERQTGFLFPRFGTSSRKGVSAEFPFYWAISDSQDLTIAPLVYERRGVGVTGEARYIFAADNRGSVRGFLLEETEVNGSERGWIGIRHDWKITPNLTFKADIRGVTDDGVLREYGDQLLQRSEQRVESNVFLTRTWPTWNLVGNAFWYQDLTTRRPIELNRLPDITLVGVRQPIPGVPGALYELEAGAVRFVREIGSDGSRVDFHPRLSWPVSPGGLFTVTPFAGGRLTAYDRRVTGTHLSVIDHRSIEDTEEDLRLRQIIEGGTDVQAIASRVYRLEGPDPWFQALLHTIEPRVNYLWLGGRNMDRLPAWTEIDRLQPTHRIEYSMVNRLQGKTEAPAGTEAARLEVIRLLVGHSIDLKRDGRGGDFVADLILQPTSAVKFRGDIRQGTHGEGIQNASTDISVSTQRFSAGVGTRYSDPAKINFLQGNATSEITRNVIARVTTNWDLRTDTFVESRFGVDLRFQCYAISVDYVNRSREAGRHGEDEVRFTVNLLGVGGPITNSLGLGALTSAGGSSSR